MYTKLYQGESLAQILSSKAIPEMSGYARGVLEFLVEVLKVMCSFPGGTLTQKEEMYAK